MDALSDHEVVKFFGRDCRALEAGYDVLLTFLCEDSAAYAKRLEAKNAALLTRQAAAVQHWKTWKLRRRNLLHPTMG